MKHPLSRELFTYWDEKRGFERAPDRSDIDPAELRTLLGDSFVLAYEAGYPFRVAGTRVCALLGGDQKGQSFPALFAPANRADVMKMITIVVEELQPAVAGITAQAADGTTSRLELLLLPFQMRAHAPISLTGLLAPFEAAPSSVGDLALTSWRYIEPKPQPLGPRLLRKLAVARGLMVYEGFR